MRIDIITLFPPSLLTTFKATAGRPGFFPFYEN